MSKTVAGIERVTEIIFYIDKSQNEWKFRRKKDRRFWWWPLGFAAVSIFLSIIFFAFGAKFVSPRILLIGHFLIFIFIAVSYVMLFLANRGLIGPNRESPREPSRNPFEVVLNNVKIAAKIDFQYAPELMENDVHALENTLFELKTEREFVDRRMALMVGAIDKVGILPGIVAMPSLLKDIGSWNWLNVLTLVVPVIYVLSLFGNDLLMRLDRMIKLLELCIQRKKAEGALQDAS